MQTVFDANDPTLATHDGRDFIEVAAVGVALEKAIGGDFDHVPNNATFNELQRAVRDACGYNVELWCRDRVHGIDRYRFDGGNERTMVLINDSGHWQVACRVWPDDVRGYYPTERASQESTRWTTRSIASTGRWHDWRQLYLAANEVPDVAEAWSGWHAIAGRLDDYFGTGYAHHPVTNQGPEVAADTRVAHLRGWANYHHTHVVVNWRNRRGFVILPGIRAVAHEHARPGRAIWVELGDDGARHYFTTQRCRHGGEAWSLVFDGYSAA